MVRISHVNLIPLAVVLFYTLIYIIFYLGGLIGSTIHKSTSSSSLPMFDPLSNNSTLNNNEQSGGNWLSMNNDNIDEDLDDDLDKILQHIKAGQNSLNDQTGVFSDLITLFFLKLMLT